MRVVTKEMETRVTLRREKFVADKNTQIQAALAAGDTAHAKMLTEWRDSFGRASSKVRTGARISQG